MEKAFSLAEKAQDEAPRGIQSPTGQMYTRTKSARATGSATYMPTKYGGTGQEGATGTQALAGASIATSGSDTVQSSSGSNSSDAKMSYLRNGLLRFFAVTKKGDSSIDTAPFSVYRSYTHPPPRVVADVYA